MLAYLNYFISCSEYELQRDFVHQVVCEWPGSEKENKAEFILGPLKIMNDELKLKPSQSYMYINASHASAVEYNSGGTQFKLR